MNEEKNRKISLLLLRLAAMIFGLVTALECGVLAYEALRPELSKVKAGLAGSSAAVIGGADGPTAIYMTVKTPLAFLLPLLYLLPPVLTAVTLVLLHRRKKKT